MLGEFDFSDEKLQDTIGVLPPKCRSKSSPKIGRRQIDDIYAVSIGYRKSYSGFCIFEPLGPMTNEEASHFKTEPGAPVLVFERKCFGPDGSAVEFTTSRYNGEVFDFVNMINM